jgi:hypothetical protein
MNIICFLFGHKGKKKCKRCLITFGFPKYPNPPKIPKKFILLFVSVVMVFLEVEAVDFDK